MACGLLMDADVSKLSGKRVRVNIALPERVLAIMDEAAKREGDAVGVFGAGGVGVCGNV